MTDSKAKWLTGFLFALLLGAVYLGIHTGAAVSGSAHVYSWNPVQLAGDLLLRGSPWPRTGVVFSIVFAVLAVAVFTWLLASLARRRGRKRSAASLKLMSANPSNAILRKRRRTEEARRLHPTAPGIGPGQKVARIVGTRRWVYQGWEETGV